MMGIKMDLPGKAMDLLIEARVENKALYEEIYRQNREIDKLLDYIRRLEGD